MTSNGRADLTVDPQELTSLAQYISDTSSSLRSALTSVAGDVGRLLEDGWTGDAATAFGQGWDDCRTGGEHILHALNDIGTRLASNSRDYTTTDSDNSERLYRLNLDV